MKHFWKNPSRKTSLLWGAGLALVTAQFPAFAQSPAPILKERHPLKEALQLEVTPRGEEFLGSRFSDILTQLGISPTSAYFPELEFDFDLAEKPASPTDEFRVNSRPVYRDILETLEEWLLGLKLADPQLHLALKDVSFEADLVRSQLRSRPDFLPELRSKVGQNAIGFELALEFRSLKVGASNISIDDRRNDFLGTFGISNPKLGLSFAQSPLVLTVPLVFFLDKRTGQPQIELLKIALQMQNPELRLEHSGLKIPPIELKVNGRSFPLNTARLEKLIDDNKTEWLDKALVSARDFVNDELGAKLQAKLNPKLPKEIVQITSMSPAGMPVGSKDPHFLSGMHLTRLMQPDNMRIHFDFFVEDPRTPKYALGTVRPTSGLISFNEIPVSQFDVGLGIDMSVINRILDLSFRRGYIRDFKDEKGETLLRLAKTPKLRARHSARSTSLAIDMEILQEIEGMQKWLLSNPLRINVTVWGYIQTTKTGGLEVILNSLDTKNFRVDESQYSGLGKVFKGKIQKVIGEQLAKAEQELRKKPISFGDLPLPPEVFGMKFKSVKHSIDPSGAIVLYLRRP